MSSTKRERQDPGQAGRNPSDVTVLLLELERVLRARRFYPEGDSAGQELLDRSWRIWHSDLQRQGALDLELRAGGFWLAGNEVAVGRGRLEELAREFVSHGLARAGFDPSLDAVSFRRLIDVLASDPIQLGERGGWERAFPLEKRQGIQLDEVGLEAAQTAAPAAAGMASPPTPPTGASPAEAASLRLGALLRELGEAGGEASRYIELCEETAEAALRLVEQDLPEQAYAALVVLAEHAANDAKHPGRPREAAQAVLRRLARGALLTNLIHRACSPDGEESVAATQLLLQLGTETIPPLFDALEAEANPSRHRQLGGVLTALAPVALPHVVRAIEQGSPRRMRTALRLAGDSQNSQLVPVLRRVGLGDDPALRLEAARALARIGSVAAMQVLTEMLRNSTPGAAQSAIIALGASGNARATAPLLEIVERALSKGRVELALGAIRALGRLGCPQAIPALTKLLERRSLRQRRRVRELKLAAVAALARLPGVDARVALERSARSRDTEVRRAARLALLRQASEMAHA
jgi:HEAT repeat protein